jgi:hypothetical protein
MANALEDGFKSMARESRRLEKRQQAKANFIETYRNAKAGDVFAEVMNHDHAAAAWMDVLGNPNDVTTKSILCRQGAEVRKILQLIKM